MTLRTMVRPAVLPCLLMTAMSAPALAQDAEPAVTLQLLHTSDLEGNADAVENAPNFAAIVESLMGDYETSLLISAGDNFIPSPFSLAAGTSDPDVRARLNAALNAAMSEVTGETHEALESAPGRFDIAIMNVIGFDASALGNHELDFGQASLLDVIAPAGDGKTWVGSLFPFLSANLTVGPQSVLDPIFSPGIGADEDGAGTIAPYTVIEKNGERFGVIGITTPLLATISSTKGDPNNPHDDIGTRPNRDDMLALAGVIQPIIDEVEAQGIDKIILTSHLQQIALEVELAELLDGVDIIIAGGSDTRLADDTDRLRDGDEAQGPYPIFREDEMGNPVAIVSTDGQLTYVGRLVIGFDADGRIIPSTVDPAVSGAYASDDEAVLEATGAPDISAAITASPKGRVVRDLVRVIEESALDVSGRNYFADVTVDLNGDREPGVRTEETNLGNLTADANLAYANELSDSPVLISLKNGGGIRDSIPNDDGKISELEIQQALAFNNGLTLITLSPQQLLEVLDYAVSGSEYDAQGKPLNAQGRFPQVAGLRFSFDPLLEPGERVQDVTLLGTGPEGVDVKIIENGDLTRAADQFAVGIRAVSLNFLVDGGDGYPYPSFVSKDPKFANVVQLLKRDVIADGAATFTNVGTEQDALAEYLAAQEGPVSIADTKPAEDQRILNLAVPGVVDTDDL
ncbi:bifunctional metallophosphatase/5'-nucleotidase [Acuticoccus sp. M5D2P5]|uniref:bifunctional metallophosphatase/5'-nucleotidase n=1 Tax=Acuticoccus kalidii TaxID=2910977 RepID=UPI001F19263F|nr:bifunctional metallophosphatase/5'-nucleotidase [Acuticoccus kalidii]MCF3932220.1 bifunctional metallophosphatase/5'-nucleotidase [Acuticoccus kalidii]